jgi:hypothetical protein
LVLLLLSLQQLLLRAVARWLQHSCVAKVEATALPVNTAAHIDGLGCFDEWDEAQS